LPRYLRSVYLPGALVIASAGPIFINHLIPVAQLHSTETAIPVGTWSLTAILLVPLVITAWQYDIRSVVGFCLSTALLDTALIVLGVTVGEDSLYFFSIVHTILARTLLFLLVGYMITRIMTTQRQQRRSLAGPGWIRLPVSGKLPGGLGADSRLGRGVRRAQPKGADLYRAEGG